MTPAEKEKMERMEIALKVIHAWANYDANSGINWTTKREIANEAAEGLGREDLKK